MPSVAGGLKESRTAPLSKPTAPQTMHSSSQSVPVVLPVLGTAPVSVERDTVCGTTTSRLQALEGLQRINGCTVNAEGNLDDLLSFSVKPLDLRRRSSFNFEPVATFALLQRLESKLATNAAYFQEMERWLLLSIRYDDDCRERLDDALELLVTKECLGDMSWTGAGNNKAGSMRELTNLLELLYIVGKRAQHSVDQATVVHFLKMKLRNASRFGLRKKRNAEHRALNHSPF